MEQTETIIKIILVGDSNVGKSSTVSMYCKRQFEYASVPTVGVDFNIKKIKINECKCKLHIWDTAGLEKFRSITNSYYRNVDAIVLMFDLTDNTSLKNINRWIKEIRSNIGFDDYFMLLVGNKCEQKYAIDYQMLNEIKNNYAIDYVEISAKQNIKVDLMFYKLCERTLLIKHPDKYNSPNLFLSETKKNCCF